MAGSVIVAWLVLPLATSGVQLNGNRWVHEGLRMKVDASRARTGKVLLLGGSNVLFGLSARRLKDAHGIHAYNLGQHAGLGRRYILSYGASAVRSGDIVVLSLEYPLWETEKSRDTRNYYVLAHDPAYLYHQRPLDILEFVAGVRFEEWRTLLAARGRSLDPAPRPGYQIANIDAWGDETSNRVDAATPAVKAAALSEPMRGPFMLDRRAIREVRAFSQRLSSGGARLVVTFPGVLRRYFAWDTNRQFYHDLVAQLQAADVVLAGTPEDSPFDEECLFDSKYHPIHSCTVARTDRLAGQLKDLGAVPRTLVQ